jgi:ribA/ribD-fused uncharacterized protein
MSDVPEWMATFKKEMLAEMKVMINESFDIHSERMKVLEVTVTKHTAMFKHLQNEHKELSDRMNNLEMRSMSENIIISGLDESDTNEHEDALKMKVATLLEQELDLDPDCIRIVKCHRQPRPTRQKTRTNPRNVLVRLGDPSEVQTILRNANKLKGRDSPIYINRQFPSEIAERRRVLDPVFRMARSKSMKASLVQDRLYIDDSLYTVENVCSVPFSLSELNERTNETTLAFLGQFSPLSNFYPTNIMVDDMSYCCTEQFYQSRKAALVGDIQSETSIMMSTNPLEMKRTGDAIVMQPADRKSWDSVKDSMMKKAVAAKFTQNEVAKQALLNTGTKKLAEASMDKHWGCGKRLRDQDLLTSSKWKAGKNTMGKILTAIRKEIASN